MNVCMILAGKFSKLAGLEKHFIELSKGLSKNLDLTIIAHESYRTFFKSYDIKFISMDLSKSRINLISYFKLFKILKEKEFDVIHTQANKATYLISKLKRFFPETKFIATIHNKKKKVNFFNKMDLVIGVSDFVCSQISTKTKTIYNGIEVDKFLNSKKVDLKEKYQLDEKPVLIAIGRLVKAKGFDLLIKAISNIDVNLLIVGDGPEKAHLERLISEKDILSRVKITGFVSNVEELIKSSDLVIISSRNEGFSYVFAETLCSRRPLISTDVADIKKFIPHSFLIPSKTVTSIEKTIKDFFSSEVNLDNYYNNAINTFSINNMIRETRNEYIKISET